MRLRRAWVAALLMAALAGAATAPSAQARGWLVPSCQRGQAGQGSGLSWFAYNFGYAVARYQCPDPGLQLGMVNDPNLIPGMGVQLTYWYDGSRVAPSVLRLKVHGGDTAHGVEYGIARCVECGIVKSFGERGPDDDAQVDPTLQFTASEVGGDFVISSACVVVGCHEDRPLYVYDIEVGFQDDEPPTMSVTSLIHPDAFSASGDSWLQPGREPVAIDAADDGAGIGSASATLDNRHTPLWSGTSPCQDPNEYLNVDWAARCVRGLHFAGTVDLTGLADGLHKLTLRATDGMGNTAVPEVRTFNVDGTAPAQPTGVHVEADAPVTASNWTRSAAATLHWDAPPTDGGSPITDAYYRLAPLPDEPGTPVTKHVTGTDQGAIHFPRQGRFTASVWFRDAAGNVGEPREIPIGYDNGAVQGPELETHGWISEDDLLRSVVQRWTAPSPLPLSGICGYSADVTRHREGEPGAGFTIEGAKTTWLIPGPLAEGRQYVHMRAISCSGRTSDPVSVPLDVDTVAPTVRIAGAPPERWSRSPYRVALSGTDDRSGIAAIRWSLDGGPQQDATAGSEIPIGAGDHSLRVQAVDQAGNVSAPLERTLGVDSTPPTTTIEPRDPGHPAVVHARAVDALSGVERAWLEIRRQGDADAEWHAIGPVVTPSADATAPVELSGELPDETAPAGTYDLRVVAIDRAGNATDAPGLATFAEGQTITLPARSPVTLQVAIGRVSGSKILASAASANRALAYAQQPAAVGSLLGADGQALAGAPVQVTVAPAAGPTTERTLTTDASGRFSMPLRRGPSRVVTARFPGTDLLAPRTTSAALVVKAGVTLRLSRPVIRGGSTIVFSGRILGTSTFDPTGKVVVVEFARIDRWSHTTDGARVDAQGRFRIQWPTLAVTHRTRLRFRALVQRDGRDWPYADAGSPSQYLTLVP